MSLHPSTFQYLAPTDEQLIRMGDMRNAVDGFARRVELALDDGPDKTYILRKIREVGMWINVAITRFADGAPRP